jgi:GTP-binding protein Era
VLVERIVGRLPEGPLYFPADQITEQPLRFLAGEIVREKVIQETSKELPYACAVIVREYEEKKNLVRIAADVFVERDGQKAIVIGAGGQMLRLIGTRARHELETILGQKVFLELQVRVREGWREDRRFLEELDWRRMAGE